MDVSGLTNYYSNMVSSQKSASANKISNMTDEDMANKTDEELMDVCKQFESYLLEQVYKEMEKTAKVFSDDEDEDSSNAKLVDYFMDSTIQEIANQSTEQNNLGIAQMMYEQMKRNYNL